MIDGSAHNPGHTSSNQAVHYSMKRIQITPFNIAATYIGTVVGAGFASGQEVLQFFGYFGLAGTWGLTVATLLFAIFGLIILEMGWQLQATCHRPVVHHVGGTLLGNLADLITTFFLFGAYVIMVAGSGAIFAEQFGLPGVLGGVTMTFLAVLTVLAGIGGVVTGITLVVPLLLVTVLGISLFTLATHPGQFIVNLGWSNHSLAAAPNWPLSSVVYVSYNIALSMAVLAPLGAVCPDRTVRRKGALLGGLGLGFSAMAIYLSLLANLPEAARWEIPMVYIGRSISPLVGFLYSMVLLSEVYSTAVANLYGFAARLFHPEAQAFKWFVALSGLAALLAAQVGFSNSVRVLYPAVGYLGLFLLAALLLAAIRSGTR